MGVGSNPTSDKSFPPIKVAIKVTIVSPSVYLNQNTDSRVAQWKRAGPITQRSVDRNYALLNFFLSFNILNKTFNISLCASVIFS